MDDDAKRAEHFMKVWTLKEAYAKATGRGLAGPAGTNGSTFRLLENQTHGAVHIDFSGPDDASKWDFTMMQPCEDYVAALCFEKPSPTLPSVRLKSFRANTLHSDIAVSEYEPSILGCSAIRYAEGLPP